MVGGLYEGSRDYNELRERIALDNILGVSACRRQTFIILTDGCPHRSYRVCCCLLLGISWARVEGVLNEGCGWRFRVNQRVNVMQRIKNALKKCLPEGAKRFIQRVLGRTELPQVKLQRKLTAAMVFLERGAIGRGVALLDRAFHNGLPADRGLPADYIREFLCAVEKRRSFDVASNEKSRALTKQTRRLSVTCLPSIRWISLYHVSVRNGLFMTGGAAREKAIESAYHEAACSSADTECLVRAFKAGIDQGDFGTASEMLDRLNARSPECEQIDDLWFYYFLNTGDTEQVRALGTRELTPEDRCFLEYIAGKSVAIVGPAPSNYDVGAEIDSFDIVARFNYRGVLPESVSFGRELDISYYNGETAGMISETDDHGFFGDLDFAMFKFLAHPFQIPLLKARRARLLRQNTFLFNGHPVAVPNALFDILHFQPGRVKVFHANFWLAHGSYYAGYAMSKRKKEMVGGSTDKFLGDDWRVTFSEHDFLSQVNFVRNLWRAGLVEADDSCKEVLSLTSDGYLSAMEDIYTRSA